MRHSPVWYNAFMRVIWLCLFSCCLLFVDVDVGAAQQTETEDDISPQKAWEPPPPPPDEFDWIQLVSGEWLKVLIPAKAGIQVEHWMPDHSGIFGIYGIFCAKPSVETL